MGGRGRFLVERGDTAEHKSILMGYRSSYANKFALGADEASATERFTSDQANRHQFQDNNSSTCKARTSNLRI